MHLGELVLIHPGVRWQCPTASRRYDRSRKRPQVSVARAKAHARRCVQRGFRHVMPAGRLSSSAVNLFDLRGALEAALMRRHANRLARSEREITAAHERIENDLMRAKREFVVKFRQ